MKKDAPAKYPQSASLFQFCRRILDHKFGGIRVIDQDVGQILGFDPADCSHWKKGKKNIRSIQAMKSIAQHLGVDEKLVVDVAAGEMSDWEAFNEYTGYGNHDIDPKIVDSAKKDYYRKHANSWSREKELDFKERFDLKEEKIDEIVEAIHERINFQEAPLYLPEIVAAYPKLSLRTFEADQSQTESAFIRSHLDSSGVTIIEYPLDSKMRPFVRYQIAKAMSSFFFEMYGLNMPGDSDDYAEKIHEIRANLFAAKLLTPARLIRKELANVNVAKDLVSQLAEVFWISKAFMNTRLKSILQSNPNH